MVQITRVPIATFVCQLGEAMVTSLVKHKSRKCCADFVIVVSRID